MNQDDSFNHPAMYNANWNRPNYFDSPKQVIDSFHVCDICGKIPTEIFSGVGFSCLNHCRTCRPNAYTPKSIFAKFLWWLDCNIGEPLWPEAPTIKNDDVVTYSHLNKHHSGEPTAYGGGNWNSRRFGRGWRICYSCRNLYSCMFWPWQTQINFA